MKPLVSKAAPHKTLAPSEISCTQMIRKSPALDRCPLFGVLAAALLALISLAFPLAKAQDSSSSKEVQLEPQDPTGFASDFSVRPFAAGSITSGGDDSAFGGGVNMEYFFTEKIGVGVNYAVFAFDDEVHTVSADLVLRYPVSKAIVAPYLLVGGGLTTEGDDTKGLYRLGGGLDVNLMQSNLGVFADGVYHWVEDDEDFTIARLGVRLPF